MFWKISMKIVAILDVQLLFDSYFNVLPVDINVFV